MLRRALARRDLLRAPIQRAARRREDHLLDARRDRAFTHVQRAEDVDRRVERRLRHRDTHVGLCSEMEDDLRLAMDDQVDERRR